VVVRKTKGAASKKGGAGAKKKAVRAQRGKVGRLGKKSGGRLKTATRKGEPIKAAKSSKIASMTVMLCRVKGVTLAELCKMTGWQPHSVRAAISAIMKKKYGLEVVSERVEGDRVYRVIV
jgi:Protein of unknown function (DUF3489)